MSTLSSLQALEPYLSHPPHLAVNSGTESLQSVKMVAERPAGSRIESYFNHIRYGNFANGNSARVKVRRVRRNS